MWKEEVVPYVVRVLRLRSVVSESHLFGRGGVCCDDRSFTRRDQDRRLADRLSACREVQGRQTHG